MSKYFITSDYNKFTNKILDEKIKKKLIDESDISEFLKNTSLDGMVKYNGKKIKIESRAL